MNTVNEVVSFLYDLFADASGQDIEIYDLHQEKTIFSGTLGDDIPDEVGDLDVCSIDNLCTGTDILTINVDTEADDE